LPEALSLKASLLDRGDRLQEAYETMQTARGAVEEMGLRMEVWHILAEMAGLARRLGNIPEAERLRDQALQTVE